jgi:hypothetical protein
MTEVDPNLMVSAHNQEIFSSFQIMDLATCSLKLKTIIDVGRIYKLLNAVWGC